MLQRILSPIVEVRKEESFTLFLMFAYSFLAMAGYNVVKPATRSQFINSLGADNLPYVQLAAGLVMGFVIQGYTSAMRLLPRRWVFAATQGVMVVLLFVFWVLFKTERDWVSVALGRNEEFVAKEVLKPGQTVCIRALEPQTRAQRRAARRAR